MRKMPKYPSFDVMKEQNHWDPHTRSIVSSRMRRRREYRLLTLLEAEQLRSICSLLVDDDRSEILTYVLEHIDDTLCGQKEEGQRGPDIPPQSELIREGLEALETMSHGFHTRPFQQLSPAEQKELLTYVAEVRLSLRGDWPAPVQRAFFNRLLALTVEAYYSHPQIWSEIGYAGPAHPRGYIRADRGQLDPWEAKPER
ncbi:gluconate 2-dehydrogenase subunit 3 family protein [Paenibacillus chitinolyticus]|uniref:gluconate 2-dehydrogenase subunit 3 family protein n=1 Tax=Paenibacillus chitinolyticus TaxID=79263 RepID=UPI002DB6B675|nr:gluconate 2-dehydrogenase subunit 3 family protein [Paenibacillus chitinolyticus]MEC0244887.1 gluconate 2-dehydrogenase subunit 3 family protein [Paenibacillus chitinolyticus]